MNYFSLPDSYPHIFGGHNAPIRILLDKFKVATWQDEHRTKLQEDGYPIDWAEIGVVLNDPYVIALRDLVEFSGGYCNGYLRLFNRAYLEGGAAGVVMLPEKDGKLLLMHHFRHATRSWHWEIPRGFGEPGVAAPDQARNEVKEETGGEISEIVDLGIYYSNTGLEGNPINLFLVRMESVGKPSQEMGIDQLHWVSVKELENMIASGEITDGFTIATYTRAKLKGFLS